MSKAAIPTTPAAVAASGAGPTPTPSLAPGAPAPAPAGKDPKAEPATDGAPGTAEAAPTMGPDGKPIPPAPEEDKKPLGAQWAAISRREAKVVDREKAAKATLADAETKVKEATALRESLAPLLAFRDNREAIEKDPEAVVLQVAEFLKIPPKVLIRALAKAPAPAKPEDARLEKVEKELADRKAADEKATRDNAARAKAQQEAQAARYQETTRASIAALVAEKPEDFELVASYEDVDIDTGAPLTGVDVVWGIIEANFAEKNQEYIEAQKKGASNEVLKKIEEAATLAFEDAARFAEEYLETKEKERVTKLGRTKKFSTILTNTPPAEDSEESDDEPAPGKSAAPAPGIGRTPHAPAPAAAPVVPGARKTSAQIKAETDAARKKAIAEFNATGRVTPPTRR